eukprot:23494_1
MSPFVFSIYTLLFFVSTVALDDVTSIEITTWNNVAAATWNTVQITLWFNYTIYHHTLSLPACCRTYSITAFTIIGPSDCHKSPSSASEAKIMIENDHSDGFIIDRIAFHTSSGSWYGISGRCVDNALLAAQSNVFDFSPAYTEDELSCDSNTSNVVFCIDNQNNECAPAKQIIYFDTSRANEFIPNATWSDGTNVIPQIVSCHPTSRPTKHPTSRPTKHPTTQPTKYPTSRTTKDPTSQLTTVFPSVIYEPQSTVSLVYEKPVDVILILLLSLIIGSLCTLIAIVLVLFVRHKKRVSADNEQQMGDDKKSTAQGINGKISVITKGSAVVKEGVVRKSGADEINIQNMEGIKRTIEGPEISESSSSDGLWIKSVKVEDNETCGGNTTTENALECVDCGLFKAGRVYQGDQLFYCYDCLALYDGTQHAT